MREKSLILFCSLMVPVINQGRDTNFSNKRNKSQIEFYKLKKSAFYANKIGLEVHAGHGLNYRTANKIAKIKNISELNIGHFIISESIFHGLPKIIKRFKRIINK